MAETIVHSTRPVHKVEIRHRIGALEIDAGFTLTQPWTLLFGPSGSGKTTILRSIAGLVWPDYGRITSTTMPGTPLESEVTLLDTGKGIFVPAHKRVVRMVSQQATLFPHLTVLENMKYGMFSSHRNAEEVELGEASVRRLLEEFRIAGLSSQRPSQLSGGEAQRVNLARAFATGGGRLMLLDEPFTGLDAPLRDELIATLLAWRNRSRAPILSVTHDVAEAFQLGAEVIKIAGGKVVAQGPVEVVLAEERKQLLEQLSVDRRSPA